MREAEHSAGRGDVEKALLLTRVERESRVLFSSFPSPRLQAEPSRSTVRIGQRTGLHLWPLGLGEHVFGCTHMLCMCVVHRIVYGSRCGRGRVTCSCVSPHGLFIQSTSDRATRRRAVRFTPTRAAWPCALCMPCPRSTLCMRAHGAARSLIHFGASAPVPDGRRAPRCRRAGRCWRGRRRRRRQLRVPPGRRQGRRRARCAPR